MKPLRLLKVFSLFLLISIVIGACSSSTEVEVVDYTEIVPSAKKSYKEGLDIDTVVKTVHGVDTLTFYDSLIVDLIDSACITNVDNKFNYIPDRMGNSERWVRNVEVDSSNITFALWQFSDSVLTENAFFNWLDCLGEKCLFVKIGEEVNVSQSDIYMSVGLDYILYIKSNDYTDVKSLSENFQNRIEKEGKYIFYQSGGRKLNWLVLPPNVEGTEIQNDI